MMGRKVLLFFYNIWVAVVFISFMLILFPFMVLPITISTDYAKISFIFIRFWSYAFSKLTYIKYDISGQDLIEKGKSYIYTCNHSSYLDTPAIFLTIPGAVRILAKKELVKIPVLGAIVKAVVIVVDRSSNASRKKSMETLKRILKEGTSVFIFPEGTMNRSEKTLNNFYDGAFKMAIDTQTPVMPMVIVNSGNLFPPTGPPVRHGVMKVKICGPVDVEGLSHSDIPSLKQKVHSIMENEILKETKEVAFAKS